MKPIYKKRGIKNPYKMEGNTPAFVPVFDDTDHFHFACAHCEDIAEVVLVERNDAYAHTPTIYFYLRCLKCGTATFRKIYLEDHGKHFLQIPTRLKTLAKTAAEAQPGIINDP